VSKDAIRAGILGVLAGLIAASVVSLIQSLVDARVVGETVSLAGTPNGVQAGPPWLVIVICLVGTVAVGVGLALVGGRVSPVRIQPLLIVGAVTLAAVAAVGMCFPVAVARQALARRSLFDVPDLLSAVGRSPLTFVLIGLVVAFTVVRHRPQRIAAIRRDAHPAWMTLIGVLLGLAVAGALAFQQVLADARVIGATINAFDDFVGPPAGPPYIVIAVGVIGTTLLAVGWSTVARRAGPEQAAVLIVAGVVTLGIVAIIGIVLDVNELALTPRHGSIFELANLVSSVGHAPVSYVALGAAVVALILGGPLRRERPRPQHERVGALPKV
jgi:hypothetical protein